MDEECRDRPWDGLMPDTLGLIFRKLPLQEIVGVVPRVCKSWANVVRGPYCWHEIDADEWSRVCHPENIDRMLQMLVSRSSGSLRKLRVYGLSTGNTLLFISDNATNLQELQLPRSYISDSIFEQAAGKLSKLTFLDLSYCLKTGALAFQAVGRHCKFLATFLRNMHPWDIVDRWRSQDDEALAIATTMPNLRHLELAYLRMSTESAVQLVTNLQGLELLDVRGCWNVKLDEDLLDKVPRLRVVGPLVPDSFESNSVSDGLSSSSRYLPYGDMEYYEDDLDDFIWEDEEDEVDLDAMFYDYFGIEDGEFDWPQSP